jgi:hypothetical protein
VARVLGCKTTWYEEETMRKSLILVLTAIGGSASYAAGITEIGRDPGNTDPATWRWHVSSILADQQRASVEAVASIRSLPTDFDQRYQRYSTLGLPEPHKAQ